jgi:hypothetical protein
MTQEYMSGDLAIRLKVEPGTTRLQAYHLPVDTKEYHGIYTSGYMVTQLKFEPGTTREQAYDLTAARACSVMCTFLCHVLYVYFSLHQYSCTVLLSEQYSHSFTANLHYCEVVVELLMSEYK